jgi:hypothetical protein
MSLMGDLVGSIVQLFVGERVVMLDPGEGHPKNVPGKVASNRSQWTSGSDPTWYPGYVVECEDGIDRSLTDQQYYAVQRGVRVSRGRVQPPAPQVNRR